MSPSRSIQSSPPTWLRTLTALSPLPVIRLLARLGLWNARQRQRYRLGQLDDRLLRDMGISRIEALRESDKPFWRD